MSHKVTQLALFSCDDDFAAVAQEEWFQSGEFGLAAIDYTGEPTTLAQALRCTDAKKWVEAMWTEIRTLQRMGTYELVALPPGRKAIGTRWVFRIKRNPDGSISKYKARLVAKGYAQKKGVDFESTYAPVAMMASIRTLLAIAAAYGLPVRQLDVDSAYLNGFMDAEVYMQQPPGFESKEHPEHVCRLLKALYGLKQAGKTWNAMANAYLLELGFVRSLADPCIYIRSSSDEGIFLVGLYVDDFVYVGNNAACDKFEQEMQARFQVKLLGLCTHVLGIEVRQSPEGIAVHQTGYGSGFKPR